MCILILFLAGKPNIWGQIWDFGTPTKIPWAELVRTEQKYDFSH